MTRVHLALLLVIVGTGACGPAASPARELPARELPARAAGASSARTSAQPANYTSALAQLDAELAELRRVAEQRKQWIDHELVAQHHITRARLSGDFADWLAAERALDTAFSLAPEGGGPVFTRATLDLSLHRLDAAQTRIAQAEAAPLHSAEQLIRLELLRGDLEAGRGQLRAAFEHYEAARARGASAARTATRLALLARREGDYEAALRLLERAEAHATDPRSLAFVQLQRGLVEWTREDAHAALAAYEAAARSFPGWWLVLEHRAEALASLGRDAQAEALYREVITSTRNPEFMDALANLLARRDAPPAEEIDSLRAAARAGHEARHAQLPAAAGAHALDHWLAHGSEPEQTLERARTLANQIPHEDNLQRLAEAAIACGEFEAARQALARARANGAKSPALDALDAQLGTSPKIQ